MMFDARCAEIIAKSPDAAVAWYLMAAYAYYVQADPILTDSTFDALAKTLLARWDDVEHIHKSFITEGDLTAGTFMGEYPSRIPHALESLRRPKDYLRSTRVYRTRTEALVLLLAASF